MLVEYGKLEIRPVCPLCFSTLERMDDGTWYCSRCGWIEGMNVVDKIKELMSIEYEDLALRRLMIERLKEIVKEARGEGGEEET